MQRRSHYGRRSRPLLQLRDVGRAGAVILEFILALPVLVILLLAVVEFSVMLQVNQQLAYASRFGAKLAAEITRNKDIHPNLGDFNLASTTEVDSLQGRIDRYLQTHGLTKSCAVVLEHNACSVPNHEQDRPGTIKDSCHCGNPPALMPVSLPGGSENEAYVRVTVALTLKDNVPDLLNTLGFALGDRTFVHSTTLRIETDNTPPTPVIGISPASSLPPGYEPNSFPSSPDCGDKITIQNPTGVTAATGSLTFNLNGAGSHDAEGSIQSYAWSVTGPDSPVINNSGSSSASVELPIPVAPGPGDTPATATNAYAIKLTVTDQCGRSNDCTINIDISSTQYDPDP